MSIFFDINFDSFLIEAKGRRAKKIVTSGKEDGNYFIYTIELRFAKDQIKGYILVAHNKRCR